MTTDNPHDAETQTERVTPDILAPGVCGCAACERERTPLAEIEQRDQP